MQLSLARESLYTIFIVVLLLSADSFAGGIATPQYSVQVPLLNDPGPSLAVRFGRVPAPGIHPRILIGPEQVIRLRWLVQNTETGKFVLTQIESYLNVLHASGGELTATYIHLINVDKGAITYTNTDWWKAKVPFAVSMECYDAMIREDKERGAKAGAALATLAMIPRNWWANDTDLVNVAFGYDFDYPYMTEEQRGIVRQTIAAAIAGKKPYGFDSPSDWRNYNWIPRGMNLLLAALAIEGEKGYDPSIYASSLEVMRDFLHGGISEAGGGLEEMHYFNFGMELGAQAMVAFARHGDDLFAEPHYRALGEWLIASMEPFGDAFSMHQDTPDDHGGLAANYAIMKWVWPNDPVIDMVWRNRVRVGYRGLSYYEDWLVPRLFPIDPLGWPPYPGKSPQTETGIDEPVTPLDYPDPVAGIEALHLPLSYWDPERGLLITRDKWGKTGMVLNFDINVQAIGGGSHYHSNSTMFTLSALGRKWAIDRGFHIAETKDSSLILIDGRGQGFFPVGGKTAEYREEKDFTVIAGDSSEPYHWITRNQIQTGASYLNRFKWEPDNRAEVLKKYSEIAIVDKTHPWKDRAVASSYLYRAPYNPVEMAFRTVALRRGGAHAYVLILDDIKKDKSSHRYDWLMQVPNDLVIKGKQHGGIILGTSNLKDDRRLLVQMISAAGEGDWLLEDYEIKRSPETGDTSSFGTGRRLRYSIEAVDPAFKVLLFPYRIGTPIPFAINNGSIDVSWSDQKDRYEITTLPSGRTAIRMTGRQ